MSLLEIIQYHTELKNCEGDPDLLMHVLFNRINHILRESSDPKERERHLSSLALVVKENPVWERLATEVMWEIMQFNKQGH